MKSLIEKAFRWMQSVSQFCYQIFFKRRFMMINSILIVIVILLGVMLLHHHQQRKIVPPSTNTVQLQQLARIEAELNAINLTIQHPENDNAAVINNVNQALAQISQSLTQMADLHQVNTIQTAVMQSKSEMLEHFAKVNSLLQAIKEQVTPQHYLPASTLPFQVVGVDIWNGRPKATITIEHDMAPPMGVNDMQDGWTLIHLQFSPAEVIFKNDKNQLVKVRITA